MMLRLIAFFVFGVGLGLIAFAQQKDESEFINIADKVYFKANSQPQRVSLGEIEVSKVCKYRVKILNVTDIRLTIDNVKVSCGCIRVDVDKKVLDAKEELGLTLSVAAKTIGKTFNQEVALSFNKGTQSLKFGATGKVTGKVAITPLRLHFDASSDVKTLDVAVLDPKYRFQKIEFGRGILEASRVTPKNELTHQITCRLDRRTKQSIEQVRVTLRDKSSNVFSVDFLLGVSLTSSWQCAPSQVFWDNSVSAASLRAMVVFNGKYIPDRSVKPKLKLIFEDDSERNEENSPLTVRCSSPRVWVVSRNTEFDLGPAPKAIEITFPECVVNIPVVSEY